MEKMQYRLIGASVVVLVIVLFAPSFIQHMNREQSAPAIMPQSTTPVVKLEKHAQIKQSHNNHSALAKAPAIANKPVASSEATKTAAGQHVSSQSPIKQDNTASTKTHYAPVQYTLQLASFKSDAKAQALISSLQKQKLSAYSHRKENSAYTAVFVGPLKSKKNAEQLLIKLDKMYHTQGLVTKHTQQHA